MNKNHLTVVVEGLRSALEKVERLLDAGPSHDVKALTKGAIFATARASNALAEFAWTIDEPPTRSADQLAEKFRVTGSAETDE